jgi:hypothetical protein
MTTTGYHGTGATITAHVGLCITDDEIAAAHYAMVNDSQAPTVHGVTLDTTGLTVAEVSYDYDECEPVLTDCAADVAEYEDCDEQGRTHRTWMLLTPAAVAALTVTTATPADEI